MTNKAYIVANEQQEHNILKKFEQEGLRWQASEKPTKWKPVKEGTFCSLPYALVVSSYVSWLSLSQLTDEEIVFDGRKEEQMSEKYIVSQEFMDELNEWKHNLAKYNEPGGFIDIDDLEGLPVVVNAWWGDEVPDDENNNRLIAIIRWVNGEDVFEVEKPKKFIVRSNHCDSNGLYQYVESAKYGLSFNIYDIDYATRFDTK